MAETFPIDFGEYRLLRKIAQGGMAEIFLAHDRSGSVCAIKRILPHLAAEESFIRMFIDEARIVSHLDHPNIAAVYDQGKIQGYYYISMEFVQGHSLLALSERAKSVKMPLPYGLLSYIVAELLAGLGCAHSARDSKGRHLGIVHRDVTPQNVLLSYEGGVKLVDFGVAKARARLTQTEAGFTKGKLSYMSPEQARGEELDGRSDLFSVGIILHEITTNGRLFNKEGPGGILGAIVNDPIPKPSSRRKDYPKRLESVVMRGLEKDIGRRWQSAEEMRDALLQFARRESPPPSQRRLRELIHDLFGPPDSQKVIEEVRATGVPTPASIRVPVMVPGASAQARDTSETSQRGGAKGSDETRMFARGSGDNLSVERAGKLEKTSGGLPAVSVRIPADEVVVPEPVLPLRVRLGHFLAALADDLSFSWRAHRMRWVLGLVGGGLAATLVLGLLTGAFGRVGQWLTATAQDMKEMREAAGLSQGSPTDAGVVPTVLRVSTEPPGASISVDGIGMGSVTPASLEDLPLSRSLEIELGLPGYRPHVEKLSLWPNQGIREMNFILVRKQGSVAVRSEPQGATVEIDGKKTSQVTPTVLEQLDADRPIKIRVFKTGYIAKTQVVVLRDEERKALDFPLDVDQRSVPPGRITVDSSPSGCVAFIDGAYAGTTPIVDFRAKTGEHSVRVACEHHGEETRQISVWANETAKVSFELLPSEFGYLTVRPIPADGSVVRINGKRVPSPVEFRKVVPGRHVVTVENARYNLKRKMAVQVGPNARVTRRINLMQ